jgi:uncharacterized protein YkwD
MIGKKTSAVILSTVMLFQATLTTSATAFAKGIKSSSLITDVTETEDKGLYDIYTKGTVDYDAAYEVLDLVNETREKLGLNPLTMDKSLREAAMQRAAENSVFYDHTRPDNTSWYTAFPDNYAYPWAENIAAGQPTADVVMNSWLKSEGHYANITDESFKSIGIGCYTGSDGIVYWTQEFSANEATDSALTGQKEQEFKVTVEADLLVLDMELDKENSTTYQITVNQNNNAFDQQVPLLAKSFDFVSEDENVAVVDSNGTITFAGYGETDIDVYLKGADNYVLSCTVSFEDAIPENIGDVTDDGKVDSRDAVTVLKDYAKVLVGKTSELDSNIADVNIDGKVNSIDAVVILVYYANQIVDPNVEAFDEYISKRYGN